MGRALMWLNRYGRETVQHKLKNRQKMHFCFGNCFPKSNWQSWIWISLEILYCANQLLIMWYYHLALLTSLAYFLKEAINSFIRQLHTDVERKERKKGNKDYSLLGIRYLHGTFFNSFSRIYYLRMLECQKLRKIFFWYKQLRTTSGC